MAKYSIARLWDKINRYDAKGEILLAVSDCWSNLFGEKAAQPIVNMRMRYLRRLYRKLYKKSNLDISTIHSQAVVPENVDEVPIWCCWFQGEEAMPQL
ncbi:MAG: hypothetical protein HUJ90_01655, partial [Bacteroidales bacterium]|nr:hypothetical protein [Bacteroidales bacterium]